MSGRRRIGVWVVPVLLLLMPLPGCSGDDGPEDDQAERAVPTEEAVAGSFVGEVSGTGAFVAVVAAPAAGESDSRGVQVYVSDGRGLNEWFSGSISDNRFVAGSDDRSMEARGTLSGDSIVGTVRLPNGKTARYEAARPAGPAGLYELTVSADGELSGTSAAGLGITGEVTTRRRGRGTLVLVDGNRLELDVARDAVDPRLRADNVRLIVLANGQLKGAGRSLFIRSAS